MNKIKLFSRLGFIAGVTMMLASCGKEAIATPGNFAVDDDYKLTWDAVEDAKNYKISIYSKDSEETDDKSSRKPYLSLSKLEEGDYIIKVQAISDSDEYGNSAWSKAFEYHKEYDSGCVFTLINNNSEYELTKAGTASGEVKIDDTYKGKPITRIANKAFKGNSRITSIHLGKYIRSIGDYSFYSCSKLTSINIPDSVTSIGTAAFQNCKYITDITLPEGITEVSDNTFMYCRALKNINFSSTITKIGENAFKSCTSLETITIPDTVESIGANSFSECTAATTIVLGKNLSSLGDEAFYGCTSCTNLDFSKCEKLTTTGDTSFGKMEALESVKLPDCLQVLGIRSFKECKSLVNIDINDSIERIGAYAFENTKIYTDTKAAGERFLIIDRWVITSFVLEENPLERITENSFGEPTAETGIVGLADHAFANCKHLEVVKLPKTCKVIGEYAFYHNTALYKLILQDDSVEIIYSYAFQGCTALTSVTLNDGLRVMKTGVFKDCAILKNEDLGHNSIPETVQEIGQNVFANTAFVVDEYGITYAGNWVVGVTQTNYDYVQLKEDVIGICNYAFLNAEYLTSVTYAQNATHIGVGAFSGCTNLIQIKLSDNLEFIPNYCFYNCTNLLRINMPITLQYIGRSAFYKCTSLNSVDFSYSDVKKIDEYAFYGCTALEEVLFNQKIEELSNYIFTNCTSLDNVVITSSIKKIGNRTFSKCTGLTTLTFEEGLETLDEYAFFYCSRLKELNFPDSLKNIGSKAFYKCNKVETINFGSNVETIDTYAFFDLYNVKELNLPASIKTIKAFAFKGFTGLNSIIIPASIGTIEQHAFYYCKNATFFTDADSMQEGWHARFNSSFRPMVFGCTLSEDGKYVVSFNYTSSKLSNVNALNNIGTMTREGYTFLGWATAEGSSEVAYQPNTAIDCTDGTVLYSVWKQNEEVDTNQNGSAE